jgi:hypothetical protein
MSATIDQTEDYVVCLSDEAMARYSAEAAHSTRTARRHETLVKLAALVVVAAVLIWGLK